LNERLREGGEVTHGSIEGDEVPEAANERTQYLEGVPRYVETLWTQRGGNKQTNQ